MAPLRGWAPKGERLRAKVPFGHWNTMTFIATLRHDRIDAPWLLDHPINGDRFEAYIKHALLPTLRRGDVVVADNLASHKRHSVRELLRRAGIPGPFKRLPWVPGRELSLQSAARATCRRAMTPPQ